MVDARLTFACGLYDRVLPLYRRTIKPEGITLDFQAIDDPRRIVQRLERGEVDAGEMFSTDHVTRIAAGNTDFVALPVFVSRVFRHGFIFCNRKAGIARPRDLEGKRVGLYSYKQSAVVFIRGLLQHDYGVDLAKIEWVLGAMHRSSTPGAGTAMFDSAGGPIALPKLTRPANITIDRSGKSLSDRLADGEIEAVIGAIAPNSFGQHADVVRLIPNLREAEKDYFRRTRIFPIMHLIAIRREVHEKLPFAARSLYDALVRSKDLALERMHELGALAYMLPWLRDDIAEMTEIFGAELWPYGIEPNRPTLSALVTYMAEQGLVSEPPAIGELFVPGIGT